MNRNLFFYLAAIVSFLATGTVVAQPTTFNYTGSVQTYTVPSGCTAVGIDMAGAQGGGTSTGSVGGKGGRVQASLAVSPSQVLNIYVGQVGTVGNSSSTVKNGGFNGASGACAQGGNGYGYGGGGGGAIEPRGGCGWRWWRRL